MTTRSVPPKKEKRSRAEANAVFARYYKTLNDAQKKAVDTIEGPVMVVAGPGTGKTHILTLRIANILSSTDTPPDGVLALTFTEAGVDAMKRRLLKMIGPTAYKVGIYTFHGFCNDVIHSHPEYFPRIISSVALTDIESILYIRQALTELPLSKLKPFGDPYFYVQPIKSAISTLKREHRTPQDVIETSARLLQEIENDPESVHQKGAHKGKVKGAAQTQMDRLRKEHELGLVFEWYEQKLAAMRKFDFDDMIGEVVRALEADESFRLTVQEKYLYILADEHQDANGSQNKLLELLASYHESPNLFIVGDEKQAIFRFQGATLDSFSHFQKLFPNAVLIPLTDSYRSGTALLDAAHGLMRDSIPEERHPKLVSKLDNPNLAYLEQRTFSSEETEIAWVVSAVAENIAKGVSPDDIAIMYRTNADAKAISRALSLHGILHALDSKSTIFHEHVIAQLVTYLRLCMHIGSNEYLAHVLHFPWSGITPHDVYKILIFGDRRRIPYVDVIASREYLQEARVHDAAAVSAFSDSLRRLSKMGHEENARDFFDRVLHESGLLSYVLKRTDAVSILSAVRGLARTLETLSATKTLYTGRDFVEDIGLYEEYGIEIEPDIEPKERTGAIHLVTAHRSKGLEYEYVYIVHARDAHWGNRSLRNNLPLSTLAAAPESDLEDERRLFYVALTRAKHYVSVSYGTTSATRTRESTITQFMLEIDPDLVTVCETEAFESSIRPEASFAVRALPQDSMSDAEFLRDAFIEQGISATALNNYLDCPWKYFYRNLVRVPEKPTQSSLYGNALHNALRLFRDVCASTRVYQPLPVLLDFLKTSVDTQGFTPVLYEEAHAKGVRALTEWHERNKVGYQFHVLCEKKFEVYMPLESAPLDTVLLRGLIDVIEFSGDGDVRVIDYKTGKHKSRNEIEGGTKNATGDYKRQLDFYCILLERAEMQAPSRLSLEFIEPDTKGNTVVHDFMYDAPAVAELKETIRRVAGEIFTLTFMQQGCKKDDCEYCALHELTERA
jgi:DNA helicase-2/ATP-dependent DNA helicase PcrA